MTGVQTCALPILISSSYWFEILKFLNAATFNLSDPLFNKDISFFIFKLPVYSILHGMLFGVLILLTAVTVVFYLFTAISADGVGPQDGNILNMDRSGRYKLGTDIIEYCGKQLAFLISAIFLVYGVGFILKNYNLVYSPRGVAFGASYTDVSVSLMFNKILVGLSVLAAVSIFYALLKRKVKMTLWIVGLM